MTHLLISCEHDMDFNINYLSDLAKLKGKKRIDVSFPSKFMMVTFMDNLLERFDQEDVPSDTEIDLRVYVPKE